MSEASTRWCPASGSTLRIQCVHEPEAPWSSTSGGPAPHARHTMSPHATSVTTRVPSDSIRATWDRGSPIDPLPLPAEQHDDGGRHLADQAQAERDRVGAPPVARPAQERRPEREGELIDGHHEAHHPAKVLLRVLHLHA